MLRRKDNRTSLYSRMSRLFGLLVTVPLIISGLGLSIAGSRGVHTIGDLVSKQAGSQISAAANQYQRTSSKAMRNGGKNIQTVGERQLEDATNHVVSSAKNIVTSATNSITQSGQEAAQRATDSLVKTGTTKMEQAVKELDTDNRKAVRDLGDTFRAKMDESLHTITGPKLRDALAASSRQAWEVSAARRLSAVQDADNRDESDFSIKMSLPLQLYVIQHAIPARAAREMESRIYERNRDLVLRAMLVSNTGAEQARVPENDLPPDTEVDWSKPDTPEAHTRDALFAPKVGATLVEAPRFDERSGKWFRRISYKIVPLDSGPDSMPRTMLESPHYTHFLAVDLSLESLVESAAPTALPNGMQLLVLRAGDPHLISAKDPKTAALVSKGIQDQLSQVKDPDSYKSKPLPVTLAGPDGQKLEGRAQYWGASDDCWTVVLQPLAEILEPVKLLDDAFQTAGNEALNDVKSKMRPLLDDLQDKAHKRSDQLVDESKRAMKGAARENQKALSVKLQGARNSLVAGLKSQVEDPIDALRDRSKAEMEKATQKQIEDGTADVTRTAQLSMGRTADQINDYAKAQGDAVAGQMIKYSAILIPLFLVLALFLATMTARSLVRPINQLEIGAQTLGSGDYANRIPVQRDDELGRLAVAFNNMASAIELGQTQLQQSHDSLAAEKARIEGIVASSPDGLVMLEPSGQIAFINPAAVRYLDLSPADLPTAPFELSALPAKACERLQDCLDRSHAGEGVQEYEITDPDRRVLQVREVNLRAQSGRSYGSLIHLHDITRERVIDEMKSDFISLVSHELRTPLTSILGFSSYILTGRMGDVTDVQKTALESIHRQAKRLSAIISDFLDVSRIESGKIEMKKEIVAVNQVAGRVVEDLRPQSNEKSIRVSTSLNGQGGKLLALGDEQRIAQIFTNLLGNALKFTDANGSIDVNLSRQNGDLVCSVRDSGCGIPPDELDRVFDRFYQVEKVVTRKSGGTGLGLAIVKNIVEAHGGRIWIESEVGEGTQVSFTLPSAD